MSREIGRVGVAREDAKTGEPSADDRALAHARASIRSIRKLTVAARMALLHLRGADVPIFEDETKATFAALAARARSEGLIIAEPSVTFVMDDELRLLAWLALLQRRRSQREEVWQSRLDPQFLQLLTSCADILLRLGLRIQYRHTLPAANNAVLTDGDHRISVNPKAGSARERVLSFLAEHGVATAFELRMLGVSRQSISLLHKKGLINRIGTARYEAAATTVGKPAQIFRGAQSHHLSI